MKKFTATLSLLIIIITSAKAQLPYCCADPTVVHVQHLNDTLHYIDSVLKDIAVRKYGSLEGLDITAFILRPNRSNNVNHWQILQGSGHVPMRADSVKIDNVGILRVYFPHTDSICTAWLNGDEQTIGSHQTGDYINGLPVWENGGYQFGARVNAGDIEVRISQLMDLSALIRYDSTQDSFIVQQMLPEPINIETAGYINVTWHGGSNAYAEVITPNFRANGYPSCETSNDGTHFYRHSNLAMFPTQCRLMFWDENTNQRCTGSKPPTGLQWIMRWGTWFGTAVPATINLGGSGNIWGGIISKHRTS